MLICNKMQRFANILVINGPRFAQVFGQIFFVKNFEITGKIIFHPKVQKENYMRIKLLCEHYS